MTTASDLGPSFRHVRLLLAREADRPSGDTGAGYDLLVPLKDDARLDPVEWKRRQEFCRVRKFGADEDRIGRLRRKPGGQWYVDYEEGKRDDEVGFRLGDERFVPGEYISLQEAGKMHTYQVARVEKP